MTTVLLIRHGRSEANAQSILAGRSDTPLDTEGNDQARSLGERLADVPLDLLVSSPQLRAQQTAALVAPGRAKMLIDDSFAECDYGDWSGSPLADLASEPAWEIVQWHPSAAQFPSGETMAQMSHRAVHGIRRLTQSHPDEVIWIVTHGDIIKAIVADALGMHLDQFQRISVDTASVSVITYTPKRPFLERLNDTGPIRVTRKQAENTSEAVVGGRASK